MQDGTFRGLEWSIHDLKPSTVALAVCFGLLSRCKVNPHHSLNLFPQEASRLPIVLPFLGLLL